MPNYCYRCKVCGERELVINAPIANPSPVCTCGNPMIRDWKEESAISNFHVSRDLYSEKKKWDAKRSPHRGDYERSRS